MHVIFAIRFKIYEQQQNKQSFIELRKLDKTLHEMKSGNYCNFQYLIKIKKSYLTVMPLLKINRPSC